ncbi:MAG: tail fiber domain-containing protein [Flavobacteriales bacterium]|nr:tail fiber domain-containing protein [Flavobacteriales bacterium]
MKRTSTLAGTLMMTTALLAQSPWVLPGNGGTSPLTHYLGTTDNNALMLRTNATQRLRINANQTYTIGSFSGQGKFGAVGLSPNNTLWANGPGPFSRLHLHDGTTSVLSASYRSWMDNGITFTTNSDQMYVGHRVEAGSDQTSAVIQWGDNEGVGVGPDVMKFLFTADYTNGAGPNSMGGREIARMHPSGFLGVGDWQAVGLQPDERVDLLDRTIRLRSFVHPTLYRNDTYDRFLVANPANGRVYWRPISSLPSNGCEWTLMNSGVSGPSVDHDVYTAVGTSNDCPDETDAVGIGTSSPKAKLEVFTTSPGLFGNDVIVGRYKSDLSGGRGVRGTASSALSTSFSSNVLTGVQGIAENGKYAYGVEGASSNGVNAPGTAQDLVGVRGTATASNGNALRTIGVYGRASGAGGGNDWAAWFDGQGFLGAAAWQYSDENLKQNMTDLSLPETVAGLMGLHPKSYTFNTTLYPYLHFPEDPQFGLIAQEVETVFPQLVKEVTRPAQQDTAGSIIEPELAFKAMNYTGLIPLLVAGFQQQQQMIDQQQDRISQLQQEIAQCCATQHPGMGRSGEGGLMNTSGLEDVREQRLTIQPNPFTDRTTLGYYVPQAGMVSLQFSTSDGKPLGTLREEQAEAGAYTYEWNTSRLASGTYFCTYMLDGAVVVKRAVKVVR